VFLIIRTPCARKFEALHREHVHWDFESGSRFALINKNNIVGTIGNYYSMHPEFKPTFLKKIQLIAIKWKNIGKTLKCPKLWHFTHDTLVNTYAPLNRSHSYKKPIHCVKRHIDIYEYLIQYILDMWIYCSLKNSDAGSTSLFLIITIHMIQYEITHNLSSQHVSTLDSSSFVGYQLQLVIKIPTNKVLN
jgi:hypothetical protein